MRGMTTSLAKLKQCSLAELEELYAAQRHVAIPEGCFRGSHLARLPNPGARKPITRISQSIAFDALPYGVDFRSCLWFFLHPRLQIGRFAPTVARSRWRDTDTVALSYHVSRLPPPIRGLLYDEVKPLSETLCLGLGGLNRDRDRGDHFFFALERM